MPKIHFLNVNQGDCIILEHNSDRLSIFDISAGNIDRVRSSMAGYSALRDVKAGQGNYRMCQHPTNPLDYLTDMKIKEIWRFILSHPDMDHLTVSTHCWMSSGCYTSGTPARRKRSRILANIVVTRKKTGIDM